ncbi:MAG: hypothetical protein VYD45_11440 [Pseudomonadota bacterium]|nr:hypothetical protein [Pseudomonadota bacterium]
MSNPEVVGYAVSRMVDKLGISVSGISLIDKPEDGHDLPLVRLTDHEAAHAAARARIVELEDVAREALAVIERLRPDRAGMGTIVRLKAALAQQGKEGET